MARRYVTIWFRHLRTDWFTRRHPELQTTPFVLAAADHGRMMITAVNPLALQQGIMPGNVAADARAIYPGLQVFDDPPGLAEKLLTGLAKWFIRFTPFVAIDLPDGLILDASGCAHLWGGEQAYLTEITKRLTEIGYATQVAMADTIGAAWAISRSVSENSIISPGEQGTAILNLHPSRLRLDPEICERLDKLGLIPISRFIRLPRASLRRRFGQHMLLRIDQALGTMEEVVEPVEPIIPYQERLPCLEPIATLTGIEIALQRLLEALCLRLQKEQKGLRIACFSCYRIDGKTEKISIGTNRGSHHVSHLFKLFELKLGTIEPALGIELFTLDALKVEEVNPLQERIWEGVCGLDDTRFSELMDRIEGKIGEGHIHRYLPDEHYWPERSLRLADSIHEQVSLPWHADKPRPMKLLARPEPIEVSVPVPDYPPMLFRYKGQLHTIKKADGPERIEREWWLEEGPHRDYYSVEDEAGQRFWVFRSGHYTGSNNKQWFIHGFFA